MCEKCDELDVKIEHYRRLAVGVQDQKTSDAAAMLIEELKAKKITFRCKPEE